MEKRRPISAPITKGQWSGRSTYLDTTSLSSIGTMETASVVASCFGEESSPVAHEEGTSPPSQKEKDSASKQSRPDSARKPKDLHRECPHCQKKLSSYHAVQTHLRVSRHLPSPLQMSPWPTGRPIFFYSSLSDSFIIIDPWQSWWAPLCEVQVQNSVAGWAKGPW